MRITNNEYVSVILFTMRLCIIGLRTCNLKNIHICIFQHDLNKYQISYRYPIKAGIFVISIIFSKHIDFRNLHSLEFIYLF